MRRFVLFVCAAVILCACSPKTETVTVFAVTEDGIAEIFVRADEDVVAAVLSGCGGAGVNFGIRCAEMKVAQGKATLYLTAGYRDLPGYTRTQLNACLTLTLSRRDDVDGVEIYVGDKVEQTVMTERDFIRN